MPKKTESTACDLEENTPDGRDALRAKVLIAISELPYEDRVALMEVYREFHDRIAGITNL